MLTQPALITLLSVFVSAPAVLAGQLFHRGDHTRGMQVAFAELLVILVAAAIACERRAE